VIDAQYRTQSQNMEEIIQETGGGLEIGEAEREVELLKQEDLELSGALKDSFESADRKAGGSNAQPGFEKEGLGYPH